MARKRNEADTEKLISLSEQLLSVLKNNDDLEKLSRSSQHFNFVQQSCIDDFQTVQTSLHDYKRKIDACKQKTEEVKSEIAADLELDRLQKELQEELEKDRLLKEEVRVISNDIIDLERQILSVNDLEKEDRRAQSKLSMYASVTNIIPYFGDQRKVSGCIFNRDKKVVEKFEFEPVEMSAFDLCNNLWKSIDKQ